MVASSAKTDRAFSPVMKLVRSTQCVPISPTDRSAPPLSLSSRQFQSSGRDSQS